jgi:hypothetical protein
VKARRFAGLCCFLIGGIVFTVNAEDGRHADSLTTLSRDISYDHFTAEFAAMSFVVRKHIVVFSPAPHEKPQATGTRFLHKKCLAVAFPGDWIAIGIKVWKFEICGRGFSESLPVDVIS